MSSVYILLTIILTTYYIVTHLSVMGRRLQNKCKNMTYKYNNTIKEYRNRHRCQFLDDVTTLRMSSRLN